MPCRLLGKVAERANPFLKTSRQLDATNSQPWDMVTTEQISSSDAPNLFTGVVPPLRFFHLFHKLQRNSANRRPRISAENEMSMAGIFAKTAGTETPPMTPAAGSLLRIL